MKNWITWTTIILLYYYILLLHIKEIKIHVIGSNGYRKNIYIKYIL